MDNQNTEFIKRLGLLGIISWISYITAIVFSPLAYPGYDWIAQAVSDLSATDSTSRILWSQLAAVYDVCSLVCLTIVCIYIKGKLNKVLRLGIYLFTVTNWLSGLGYKMFPLSESGYAGKFTDFMHMYVITVPVIILTIASLVLIMVGAFRKKAYVSLGVWAAAAFFLMLIGARGASALTWEYFGICERLSLLSSTGFTAVLGFYLFRGFQKYAAERILST